MQLKVLDLDGKDAGIVELNPEIFSIEPRLDVISDVIRWQLAMRRTGNHQVKNRSAVRGTTKKAFKQKGTGRARRGAWTTNICRGGGVAFGPVVRDHSFKLNKKVRLLALKSFLSLKFRENNIVVLNNLDKASSKTKDSISLFSKLGFESALFVSNTANEGSGFLKSIMNLKNFDLVSVGGFNIYDAFSKNKLVFTLDSIEYLQNVRFGGAE